MLPTFAVDLVAVAIVLATVWFAVAESIVLLFLHWLIVFGWLAR